MCYAPDIHATISWKGTGVSVVTALPVLWDLLKRRRLRVDDQVSEGFSVQFWAIGFWLSGVRSGQWTAPGEVPVLSSQIVIEEKHYSAELLTQRGG